MYPVIKPNRKFFLKVDSVHSVYVEECGNINGIPALYLHGGPGGSIDSGNRRLFNPKKYRIILFDQRGSGKSKPKRSLENNTTNELINDMEKIRKYLDIKKWVIVGGSWGSTLSLAYSIKNPDKVLGLVLRGVFLGSKEEAVWAFNDAAKYFYPEVIDEIENKFKSKKKVFIELGKMLQNKNQKKRLLASIIWNYYERILSVLDPGKINIKKILNTSSIKRMNPPISPYLEWHYTKNNFFMKKNQILNGLKKIKKKPTIIIQGRFDLVCPPKSAFLISKKLSNCDLRIIPNSGHSSSEKEIRSNLVKAIEEILKKVK